MTPAFRLLFPLVLLTAATSVAAPAPGASSNSPFSEDMLNMRDPFKRPPTPVPVGPPKTELETAPVEAFKLVGILTGPNRTKAMIQSPAGKTYLVAEKTKMGVRNGAVLKITEDVVVVREKIVNILGQEENLDTEIRMQQEDAARHDSPAAPKEGR